MVNNLELDIFNKTKILVTLKPSSVTKSELILLIEAGASAFRINFSHGTHEGHEEKIQIIREIQKEKKLPIFIVADMQGPKLRIGKFNEGVTELEVGNKFRLDKMDSIGDNTRVYLPHNEIFNAVNVGDFLSLNDGSIILEICEITDEYIDTIIKIGGKVWSQKGINVPNKKLLCSAITKKDKDDLRFAIEHNVDFVALSFVQTADDILEAKEIIQNRARIISKIEKPSAIENLDKIVELSDAIMVARGDLGVECPLYSVPRLQKHIIATCKKLSTPVIVATQMLETMIHKPVPTRAEVSDIANAVYEGADAVMLSAETVAGKYPVECIKIMKSIITDVESDNIYYTIKNNKNQHKKLFN